MLGKIVHFGTSSKLVLSTTKTPIVMMSISKWVTGPVPVAQALMTHGHIAVSMAITARVSCGIRARATHRTPQSLAPTNL